MRLFFSNTRVALTVFGISIVLGTVTGCASKKAGMGEPAARFPVTNPVEIGSYYIENIFDPIQKESLYDLFSKQSQAMLSFTEFSQRIDELSAHVDTKDAFISIVALNAFVFSNDRMVVYYLMVYEKDGTGIYSVTELYFSQDMGLWKIQLQADDATISALPVIRQGDIVQLTRKELQFINQDIDRRIEQFMDSYEQPVPLREEQEMEPVVERESIEDKTERIIKKEMIVGQTYFDVGDFERAAESFEKVLSLRPDNAQAQIMLRKSLTAVQRKEQELREAQERARREAEEKARQLMTAPQPVPQPLPPQQTAPAPAPLPEPEPEPTVEDTLFQTFINLGKKFYEEGEYRSAIVQFQKALSIRPDSDLAGSYIEKCEKAIQVAPSR